MTKSELLKLKAGQYLLTDSICNYTYILTKYDHDTVVCRIEQRGSLSNNSVTLHYDLIKDHDEDYERYIPRKRLDTLISVGGMRVHKNGSSFILYDLSLVGIYNKELFRKDIELIGTDEDVKSFIEKFSTFFPEKQSKSYDGNLAYTNGDEFGWYDENTTVFTRRNKDSVLGIPEGFTPNMEKSFIMMPDFEKVYPIPQVIKNVGNSVSMNIIDAVYSKYRNSLLSGFNSFLKGEVKEIKPEDQMQFERACKAYEETGFAYWYDYQNAKWGTKWNAYDCEKINETTFMFDTAWSGVPDLILEMSKSFNGNIIYAYSDEDTGYNVGSYLFSSGITISDYNPTGGSVGAYEIAFELRPDQKQYYVLEDGEYIYKEEED